MFRFPVYIKNNDDFVIMFFNDPVEFKYMERIDIEDNLYSGWDCDGYPFKVIWIEKEGIK